MDTLTVTLQYLNPSNQHDVHLRFIQCYMSDIFEIKQKQMTPFQAKKLHFLLLSEI